MTEEGQLAVIRRWFEGMGAKVTDVPLDASIGRNLPSLAIDVGGHFRFNAVEDPGGAVVLIFTMHPSPEVTQAARALNHDNQERILILLKNALLDNQRVAWSLSPPTVTVIGDLTGIQLTQRFRVSEDDPATFNRFQDAYQELVAAQVRIQVLYETTVGAKPSLKSDEARRNRDEISGAYR